ncbi:hypothetical protein DPEC_G00172690 [Dallia pectoralis]|uniref:Uncharacterized protein n=1 Tax=Dallia pectoralis TaxID=75939 RepID=A0ACC2GDQ5_DALPE|nr:hypothetical protein DPEC_G00172690 [Dallia pectoralis]
MPSLYSPRRGSARESSICLAAGTLLVSDRPSGVDRVISGPAGFRARNVLTQDNIAGAEGHVLPRGPCIVGEVIGIMFVRRCDVATTRVSK